LLGTKASWELMQGCDTLLRVGSGLPYAEFLPKSGQARGVQIDVDAGMLGLRYPMDINLIGDAAATLAALLPSSSRNRRRIGVPRSSRILANPGLSSLAAVEADPINPQQVTHGALRAAAGSEHRHGRPTAARPRSGTRAICTSAPG
jgi:pyruvate dehydrogenase (quinone)